MPNIEKEENNFKKNLPMILVILDGWGLAETEKGNAIRLAKTPFYDSLVKEYPYTELGASGKYAGLPPKQVGNSEAGHINIGAGRLVEQDVMIISRSISDGTFFKNPGFREAVRHVKKNNSKLHIMGMLSNGMSPHSDPDHITALIVLARKEGIKDVVLHLFTDGRDSPKYASLKLIEAMEREFKNGEFIATVMGRYYAMDRKKKWENIEIAYNALVAGDGRTANSPQAAITESYNKGDSDEYIEPYKMISEKNNTPVNVEDNDSIIFFNLRSDRARQLAKAFVQKDFNRMNPGSFKRKKVINNLRFVAMTDFGPDLDGILSAYPSADLKSTLPMLLKKYKQLYLSETEKYAHVTYFFNGGYKNAVGGEARMAIPSPNVKSYDEAPTMSSDALTKNVLINLSNKWYDFTLLNFASPDMVGHTGNLNAGIICCENIDKNLEKIVKGYLKANGTIIITADHGNIEEMINLKTDEIDTEHSINKVPFIIVNEKLKNTIKLKKDGILADIAPTILELIDVEKPKEMTGSSLIMK